MATIKFWQIVVLILLVAIIGAGFSLWQPWKTTNRAIQVSGDGKIKSTPDVAMVNGGVQIKNASASTVNIIQPGENDISAQVTVTYGIK